MIRVEMKFFWLMVSLILSIQESVANQNAQSQPEGAPKVKFVEIPKEAVKDVADAEARVSKTLDLASQAESYSTYVEMLSATGLLLNSNGRAKIKVEGGKNIADPKQLAATKKAFTKCFEAANTGKTNSACSGESFFKNLTDHGLTSFVRSSIIYGNTQKENLKSQAPGGRDPKDFNLKAKLYEDWQPKDSYGGYLISPSQLAENRKEERAKFLFDDKAMQVLVDSKMAELGDKFEIEYGNFIVDSLARMQKEDSYQKTMNASGTKVAKSRAADEPNGVSRNYDDIAFKAGSEFSKKVQDQVKQLFSDTKKYPAAVAKAKEKAITNTDPSLSIQMSTVNDLIKEQLNDREKSRTLANDTTRVGEFGLDPETFDSFLNCVFPTSSGSCPQDTASKVSGSD